MLALTVPVEYGGRGIDPLAYALCILEIAKACSATALTFNMHCTVLGLIAVLGRRDQQARYFDEVVRHGRLFASITSEPESSFRDRFVIQTVFRPVDGGYHVSGLKHFCSLGDAADYYFVSGLLEGAASARKGLLSALIARSTDGVRVEAVWNSSAMRATSSHTIRYDAWTMTTSLGGPDSSSTSTSPAMPSATRRRISESARRPSNSSWTMPRPGLSSRPPSPCPTTR